MSVWKSDGELLIFASLIAPPKIILFEKKHQAFNTAFNLNIRHFKVRQKWFNVYHFSTVYLVFDFEMKHTVSVWYLQFPV